MDHRYGILRNHLDELGYKESLIIDSVPLVERLLSDLVKTTESLFHYKNVAQCAIEERDQLQLGAEPYKCDNAKLVKECNDLHLAFLQFKEQTDKAHKESKHKINTLEKENQELSRHLDDLQKSGTKSSSTTLRRRTIPSKTAITTRQSASSVSVDKKIQKPETQNEKHKCCTAMNEQQLVANLKQEIKRLKIQLVTQNDFGECLKNKLNNREKEIQRLSNMLEGGRPLHALNKDCCYRDMNAKLKHLANENSRMHGERKELEMQLSEAIEKQHEAMKRALQLADRNKELERELRDIDQMALAVEEECNSAVKKNYSQVSKVQDKLDDCQSKVEGLEREIISLKRAKKATDEKFEAVREERDNLHRILESTLDDKKKMTDRINQFLRIEHDLNLEIDRLMQTCTLQKRKITELEYQQKVENQSEEEMDGNGRRKLGTCPTRCGVNCTKCNKPKKIRKSVGDIDQQEDGLMDRLQRERDFFQQECQRLCAELNDRPAESGESFDVKRKLKEKEDGIAKLEKEVQELTREKHTLLSKLEANQEMGTWSKDMDNVSMKSTLSRVEKERDIARGDVKRLEEERDSLRKRLKTTTETHVTERDRLQKLMTDSEEQLRKLEAERREIMTVQGSRRATINNLEEQIESYSTQLRTTQNELEHIHTLYSQIKTLQEQTDRALGDTQGQLTQVEMEYAHAQDRIRELEKDRSELDKELSVLKNDVSCLKGNLTKVDCQRDNLLIEVDNKTERIAALEQELKSKDGKMISLETTITELRQQLSLYTDDAANKEYQLKSSSNELLCIRRELEEAVKNKNQAIAENRRLQNDLAKVSLDWRNSNGDLERAHREIDDLKTQLQQYVYEVKRAEDLISKKENERAEMLDQFQSICQEANHQESRNQTLETKALEVKCQLTQAQDHIQDLETKVSSYSIMNKDYEKQISQLTCQIACLETQLKQHASACSKTELDLASMKELCLKLDGQKDFLMKEIKEKDEYRSHLEREKERMKGEYNKLQDTLDKESTSIGSLEGLLAQSRQETVEQRLLNQELQTEIQRLKSMIEELQTKLTLTSQQLDVFQDKALDYSQQLKQLRREIANERFRAHSGDLSSRYPSL